MEQYRHRAYRSAVDPIKSDRERFAIIPPGVNRRIFSPKATELDPAIKARLNAALRRDLPPARQNLPLILCASRLDQKKNHPGLAQAFAHSASLRAVANLAIVARGLDNPMQDRHQLPDEERSILDEIASLLDKHALWHTLTTFPLNNQAELAAACRIAAKQQSVFALTAHYEPFGLAPLEAMSCGQPAVVTRNGGPAESLFDAQTQRKFGVLVDPDDPQSIARGLLEALSPQKIWREYQQAGLQRVISRYTWDRTAAGYLSELKGLLSEPQHRPNALPIPACFTNPRPENAIPLLGLTERYLET